MTVTIVYVHVIPEHIDAFIAASDKNHELSVKEPGNLRFDMLQKENEPGEFVLYEAYENKEAAAAHKETSHYLEWRETVAPMMSVPREGVRYDGLRP
jgi:autoinducer 2-degrading protein